MPAALCSMGAIKALRQAKSCSWNISITGIWFCQVAVFVLKPTLIFINLTEPISENCLTTVKTTRSGTTEVIDCQGTKFWVLLSPRAGSIATTRYFWKFDLIQMLGLVCFNSGKCLTLPAECLMSSNMLVQTQKLTKHFHESMNAKRKRKDFGRSVILSDRKSKCIKVKHARRYIDTDLRKPAAKARFSSRIIWCINFLSKHPASALLLAQLRRNLETSWAEFWYRFKTSLSALKTLTVP